jgi:hypothetical protein
VVNGEVGSEKAVLAALPQQMDDRDRLREHFLAHGCSDVP